LSPAPFRPSVTRFSSVHRMYTDFDKIYKKSLVTFLCRFLELREVFFSRALLYTLIRFCDLFYDAVVAWDGVMSNSMTTVEWQNGKYFKEMIRTLVLR